MTIFKTLLRWLASGVFIAVTFLWLSSYTHHTGIGIDHDFEEENRILHMIYRVSWTGHGSVWFGYGSSYKDKANIKSLETLDLAGIILQPINKPLPPSASGWNKMGFWYIQAETPRPTLWIGIPSWLPVLLLGMPLFICWRKQRRAHSK